MKILTEEIYDSLEVLRNSLFESQEALQAAHTNLEDVMNTQILTNQVYAKPDAYIGDFCVIFLEVTNAIIQCIHACHAKDAVEYLSTNRMLPELMAYANHKFGRWLLDFWAMISSQTDEQPFFSEHFAQCITGLPYSCQLMDLWVETTMNLNSKLKQRWLQLLHNEKQLFTIRNANNVARVRAIVDPNVNCHNRHCQHIECQP